MSGEGKSAGVVAVHRLSAHARLDKSPAALAHARTEAAAGDESWEQWVQEYERGTALILCLDLTLEVDGVENALKTSTRGLFVENDIHAPKLEQQIAELASGDFAVLAKQLRALGHDVDVYELSEMYVHVELDPEVRERLAPRNR